MIALIFAAVVVVGAYIVIDRRDARERAERAGLLQRIQAPDVAVAQHAAVDFEESETQPFDDDATYWKAKGEPMPLIDGREV